MDPNTTADFNNNTKAKKGLRKKITAMIRSSPKSPKLPSKNTKVVLGSTENIKINSNEKFKKSGGRRRSQSVSSRLRNRRRQSSLSNKELEKIALKYKKQETGDQISQSIQSFDDTKLSTESPLKYKTWSSLPHGLSEGGQNDVIYKGTRKESHPVSIPIYLRTDLFAPQDSDDVDGATNCECIKCETSNEPENQPKKILQKQRSFHKQKRNHKRLSKSVSSDAIVLKDLATKQDENRIEKSEVHNIMENEIRNVIGEESYQETLVQKWSKEICTHVRDRIRLQTGKKYKIIVNALIGSIVQANRDTANVCIQNSIESNDCFVLCVVENNEMFISAWALVSLNL